MKTYSIPQELLREYAVTRKDDESLKGHAAENIVLKMFEQGAFGTPTKARKVTGQREQLSGTDILVNGKTRMQVKADLPAARTGNLYLQVAESNPRKKY